MRVSTGMIFDSGVNSIQQRTSSLLQIQQQISSGRRILKPSDDPVASARALEVTQSKEINVQYSISQNNARSALGLMDGQLSSASDLLVRVRELTVQAGNAALSLADRKSIAGELRARFEEMVGLANSTDGTGQYVFSGYQGSNKPFAGSVDNGVTYVGDDGLRTLRLSGSRNLPISESGNDVFMRIKNGNGTFVTGTVAERSANVHSVSIDGGTVSNATLWGAAGNPDNIELRFWVDAAGGGVNTKGYAVGNVSLSGLSVATPLVIDSGAATPNHQFDLAINGGPPVTVTIADSTYESTGDLLNAVQAGINAALTISPPADGSATASLDTAGRLVITSNAVPAGTGSSVSLAVLGGNDALVQLFGVLPTATNGFTSVPGQTFYDLVDKDTGNSLFTGATSTAASGGSYTHAYVDGAPISFSSSGPGGAPAFDLGASVKVTGTPVTGDKFAIDRINGALKTDQATITHSNATIDKGVVTDLQKWTVAGNPQDMEVRFWKDDTSGLTYYDLVDATSGNSLLNGGKSVAGGPGNTYTQPFASVHGILTGAVDLSLGFTPVASPAVGANDTFNLTIDGTPRSITIPPGPGAGGAYTFAELQSQLQIQLSGYGVTVGASGNSLVLSSDSTLGTSSVSITSPVSNGASALLGGATPGTALSYGSSTTINLKGTTFDFGASVTVSGYPVTGDTFTIKASTDAQGNGYFVTAPKMAVTGNMGSGIIGAGEVIDGAKWNSPYNSKQLEVRFWKDPANTSANAPVYYDLVDTRTERSLFTDTASTSGGSGNTFTHVFKSGDPVAFSGLASPYQDFGVTVTIQGTPESGDVFSLQDSTTESVFDTLANLIHALESPSGPVGSNRNAELHNQLGQTLTNLSMVENNILRVRADIGTRLAEVDDLEVVSGNLSLQYEDTLSRLQDLDYAKAISDMMRMQTELQAAQQSFMKISNLSLFNYL